MTTQSMIGSAVAIFGVFAYSIAKQVIKKPGTLGAAHGCIWVGGWVVHGEDGWGWGNGWRLHHLVPICSTLVPLAEMPACVAQLLSLQRRQRRLPKWASRRLSLSSCSAHGRWRLLAVR